MKHLIILLLLFTLIACKQNKTSIKTKSDFTELQKTSLTKELDSIYRKGNFKGFSVAIVNEDETLYKSGFGYANVQEKMHYTKNTIQTIASISKTFISISLLKASELNKLNLDDPINNHLPFEVINPNYPNIPITIRQLANHTSSIQDHDFYWYNTYILKDEIDKSKVNDSIPFYYNTPDNRIELAEFLANGLDKNGKWYKPDLFLNKKPGETYNYSNTGAALCAYIIELATEIPFNEFTRKYILSPLQMDSSGWFFDEIDFNNYSTLYSNEKIIPPYSGITYPDGGFITSSSDLSKFLRELINGYNGNGKILNQTGYKEIYTLQLKENLEDENIDNVGVFMEFILKHNAIGHSGGDPGINTLMFFNPKTNIGRILITNTESDDDVWSADFWGIWKILDNYRPD